MTKITSTGREGPISNSDSALSIGSEQDSIMEAPVRKLQYFAEFVQKGVKKLPREKEKIEEARTETAEKVYACYIKRKVCKQS